MVAWGNISRRYFRRRVAWRLVSPHGRESQHYLEIRRRGVLFGVLCGIPTSSGCSSQGGGGEQTQSRVLHCSDVACGK